MLSLHAGAREDLRRALVLCAVAVAAAPAPVQAATSGASLVKDIRPGKRGAYPVPLVGVGRELFFAADDGVHGQELWRSDGTAAGTRLEMDLNPGAGGSDPSGLASVGGTVFFLATGGARMVRALEE